MKDGGLKENIVSNVRFRDGNEVDAELHFGCAVYVFDKEMKLDMNTLMELISSMTIDKDDERWITNRSFYMSTTVNFKFEFGQDIEAGFNPLDILSSLTGDPRHKERFDRMV